MAGYFSLSTTGPSKGVLFFNFFMVSHVATICTFGPILVDLLELFFGPSNHCHELWLNSYKKNKKSVWLLMTFLSANIDCRLYIYARRYPRETASPPAALVPGPIYNVTVSCELRCCNHTESSDLSCHFLRSYGTNVRFSFFIFSRQVAAIHSTFILFLFGLRH